MISVLITLTTAGSDTGPFNIYSNVDGYTAAFETNVDKADLLAGYVSYVVPDGTTIVRVMSASICTSYSDFPIFTTTTSTSSTSTTSTSTTAAPLLTGRRATIPVPVLPDPDLVISYTDTTGTPVVGQTIPASPIPTNYFLCIQCATTITIDSGTPGGSITYNDGGLVECNCA